MQYYSQYGHRDFVLCLGYKASVIKEYFLNYKQTVIQRLRDIGFGNKVEISATRPPDWRVTLVDTGIWRNIGQRLMAVKHLVEEEEIFLANYSDGLTDAPLPEMIERFKKSGKSAASSPSPSLQLPPRRIRRQKAASAASAPARRPTSGSTAATSSSAARSSTTSATARNWCLSRSTA